MKRISGLIILLLILPVFTAGSEANPHQLRSLLANATDTEEQIKISIDLGSFYEDINFDSAVYFFSEAYNLALKEQNKTKRKPQQQSFALLRATALRRLVLTHFQHGFNEKAIDLGNSLFLLGSEISDTLSMVIAQLSVGNAHITTGQYPNAVESYQKALHLSRAWNDSEQIARVLQNLGIVHYYMGHLSQAATYTHEALSIYSKLNNRLGEASCMVTLGNVVSDQENLSRAMIYYNQALALFEELNHDVGIFNSILNIGTIYLSQSKYQEAVEKFAEARNMAQKINDLQGVVRCLHNLGMGHSRLGNPELAMRYYHEALEIARHNNFRHLEANTLTNMAGVNNDQGRFEQALILARRGLLLSQEIQSIDDQLHSYRNIFRAYEGQGYFYKALEYHKLFKTFNDSLHRIESRREVSQLEALYKNQQMQQEVELKNSMLEKQTLELSQQALSLKQQVMYRNVLITGIVLLTIIAGSIYISLKRRKWLNKLITQQKEEIERINETLLIKNSEIALHRDEIINQKRIIEEKNATLISSIRYAQSIQNALLPNFTSLEESFAEYFLIYEPKEIVSGDFFWISRQNGVTLLAVADSTGHGVPGAFMSMLGISFLNEFIARQKYHSPGQLLDEMRKYIIGSLHQQDNNFCHQDGFEMALVAIDPNANTITFAGARMPVYIASERPIIINGKPTNAHGASLHKIKADHMPLALHKKMKPFSNQTIIVNPGDVLYLMTDGFADQFSCKSGERFTSQRLTSLLAEIQHLPLYTQKVTLIESLQIWKEEGEQVDDITVLGLRL